MPPCAPGAPARGGKARAARGVNRASEEARAAAARAQRTPRCYRGSGLGSSVTEPNRSGRERKASGREGGDRAGVSAERGPRHGAGPLGLMGAGRAAVQGVPRASRTCAAGLPRATPPGSHRLARPGALLSGPRQPAWTPRGPSGRRPGGRAAVALVCRAGAARSAPSSNCRPRPARPRRRCGSARSSGPGKSLVTVPN